MVLFHIILAWFLFPLTSTTFQSTTNYNQSKAKRTVSDQIYTNGNGKAMVFYMESPLTSDAPELQAAASSPGITHFYNAPSKPLALVSVQQPIQVFEQDNNPKQVTAQQVLYEFQQTPTNAESNVHVKQLFQPNIELTTRTPSYQNQQIEPLPTTQPLSSIHPSTPLVTGNQNLVSTQPQAAGLSSLSSYHPSTSQTMVSPVQHNLYTNHALDSASFGYYNPLLPASQQQYQSTHISPKPTTGKYIYLNGKIVYRPSNNAQNFPQNNLYNKGVYHNQQKLPLINYEVRHNRPNPLLAAFHGNAYGNTNGNAYGNTNVNAFGNTNGNAYSNTNGNAYGRLQNKLVPPGILPPITYNRFQAPKRVEQIEKPSLSPEQQEETGKDEEKPVNEEANEGAEAEEQDEEEESDDEEREENEADEESSDDFEDDHDSYLYESFPFEEDDYLDEEESHQFRSPKLYKSKKRSKYDEHHGNGHGYEEHDKQATNNQNTKHPNTNRIRKHRMPPKYDTSKNYGYREKYSSNMKITSPKQNAKKAKPTGKFKKVKYSKKPGSKPKIETIEGKFSDNVPITHKHNVYKERWYVTKDVEGKNKNLKNIK